MIGRLLHAGIFMFLVLLLVSCGNSGDSDIYYNHEMLENGEGDTEMDDLKNRLTPIQYAVTRENATEPPFNNEYWNNKEEGIYVDLISGDPLFSSKDKFDSGTGWPSFNRTINDNSIVEKEDRSHGMVRIEVRSRKSDSHLGHLFNDGPSPTGLRYCINSAALRFIPRDKLVEEGYPEFLDLFEKE